MPEHHPGQLGGTMRLGKRRTIFTSEQSLLSKFNTHKSSFYSLLANSMVEHCHTDDLMPNVPISCLPPIRVDPEVQGLKVIIDCPQPGSSRAT